MPRKPKLSMYWAASCGGCEIALLNLHEKILDLDAAFDFMFCPCLLDTKKKEIEALPDQDIDLTFLNCAIRPEKNRKMAFRLYAPCLSCTTLSLPGIMPFIVTVRNSSEAIVKTLTRD